MPRTVRIALGLIIVALIVGIIWILSNEKQTTYHDRVEKLPWLHGQTLSAVFAELGEPWQQFDYTMATSPGGEFRVGLYNTYPPNDQTADVKIKELQWHRKGYSVAVWLHQVKGEWIVLDTCRWKEGVVF